MKKLASHGITTWHEAAGQHFDKILHRHEDVKNVSDATEVAASSGYDPLVYFNYVVPNRCCSGALATSDIQNS